MKLKISTRIIIVVLSGVILSGVFSIFTQYASYNQNVNIIAENLQKNSKLAFQQTLANDTKKLSLALEILLQDEHAKEFYIAEDIDSLYKYSKPLFENLKSKYDITHWYYIKGKPTETCFLRVHNKPKNNDKITRFTYQNSVKTATFASGLELGKTAFALRVVHPYYFNNKLIGYMELGEEIDHFFDIMKNQTGNNYIAFINKEFLNEEK